MSVGVPTPVAEWPTVVVVAQSGLLVRRPAPSWSAARSVLAGLSIRRRRGVLVAQRLPPATYLPEVGGEVCGLLVAVPVPVLERQLLLGPAALVGPRLVLPAQDGTVVDAVRQNRRSDRVGATLDKLPRPARPLTRQSRWEAAVDPTAVVQ
ncbi:hypothetical protein KPB2_5369 [Klebsiella pneumoniae Kb677]|nr:hypothetical protein KPB2_5369 [Klebsiella pneumoniae Kb677]